MANSTTFATYLDAIATAISNDDPDAARLNFRLAMTVLPQLPNVATDGVSISYSQASQALTALKKEIESMGRGSIIMQPVEFDERRTLNGL